MNWIGWAFALFAVLGWVAAVGWMHAFQKLNREFDKVLKLSNEIIDSNDSILEHNRELLQANADLIHKILEMEQDTDGEEWKNT